ncbi:hypothetical protein HYH03_010253 [Edaphochlamys debaryana]|uniref:Uncharacterized protein n=1 Tax=Edaphochlamys debaryana TaxID=47281 RepID=A0A835XYP8_9CHLO|nr:hypothetical protein HYH03_010253 [Edaphochlamys debaryana]|eukprot:KAG2491468.1 hypothetical protein HYH03_010253 [Edaphochlamys debaryana]
MQRRFTLSVRRTPPPNPLDAVLSKAARKARLSHPAAKTPIAPAAPAVPAAPTPSKPKPRPAQAAAPTRSAAPAAAKRSGSNTPADDDSLFDSISERERESVWESMRVSVEGGEGSSGLDDDDWGSGGGAAAMSLAKRRSAPASARSEAPGKSQASAPLDVPVASSSGFRGFGSPAAAAKPGAATRTGAANAGAASTSGRPPAPSASTSAPASSSSSNAAKQAPKQPASSSGGSGRLRVFLFATEEARTTALLAEAGMSERVELVTDLRLADVMLATKLTKSGKHVNLAQGERTAANAGIPLIVLGRQLSLSSLTAALRPLLAAEGREGLAAAAAAVAAARPASRPSAAELGAARYDAVFGFGRMLAGKPGPQ